MDLFNTNRHSFTERNAPLANRMRPRTLDDFVGQDHIIGSGRLLRRAIMIDQLSSLIFYGPPGTGKTTLARIIANTTKANFININAVLAGVKDIREAITLAKEKLALYSIRTILFIDEVHRFNKAQQDALLPHVENGTLTLIGATTENPYFEVNKALVSRSRLFQLKQLTKEDLEQIAKNALSDSTHGYGNKQIKIDTDALQHLIKTANGDARGVLNALELAVESTEENTDGIIHLSRDVIEDSIQQRAVLYDKDGDAHYDSISAFIKSVRGSDPDAALYWMAKMLYAGENPRFIFRRLLILASEDVGLADPFALQIVNAAAQAFDFVGLPEGRFHLAQACLYLATAPKSNTTLSLFDAIKAVGEEHEDTVPDHLKDSSRDKNGFGHGKGYVYPHAFKDHWAAQQYLPDSMQGKIFYNPSEQGYEKSIQVTVTQRREAQIAAMVENSDEELYGNGPPPLGHKNSDQMLWEKRVSGSTGEHLAKIRDHLIHLANISPPHLVLDINARTGLLTFEVLRRIKEGTLWALCHSKKEYITLQSMAQQLPFLDRPIIVESHLDTFEKDIQKVAGRPIAFDRIIGRNILGNSKKKASLIKRLVTVLADKGKIVFSETLHQKSQRISDYLSFAATDLKNNFLKSEELLFSDTKNPLVNWNINILRDEILTTIPLHMYNSEIRYTLIRRITSNDVNFWLRESIPGQRSSLGDKIRKIFDGQTLEKVYDILHKQLDNRDVTWKTVEQFIVMTLDSDSP